MTTTYDLAVIGAGMIGSAVAKYATLGTATAGTAAGTTGSPNIVLIGPSEEQKLDAHLHGAWFDEGRIARKFSAKADWQQLAIKSIERYRQIEHDSSIPFFTECGYLLLSPPSKDYSHIIKSINDEGYICENANPANFHKIHWDKEMLKAHYEPSSAGHISPRQLVRAQQAIARSNNSSNNNGCDFIKECVRKVSRTDTGEFLLTTASGATVKAAKVVVATGAYAKFLHSLTDFPIGKLNLTLTKQTVAYLEVAESQLDMTFPSIVIEDCGKGEKLDSVYILPPIRYPNGKCYLKLGHGDVFEEVLETEEEVKDWYENNPEGDPEAVRELAKFAKKIFPGIEVLNVHGGGCVTSNTHEMSAPYVDEISPGLFIAVGGCGYAAKSSNEIGRIAAILALTSMWSSDIPRGNMAAVWLK